ncbi:hypothetical protein RGQ29_018096 [Quercus rubra]|uniref:DUF4371 domain-containing protein n=1 Tax=Quercus rubra TaxID=3512 RepID=A0AAN7FII5_QUERU|nr:hypothetical protein RGQ29_018096 [Quercus rubra]
MTDAVYCLSCFVFHNSNGLVGQNKFIVGRFRNWRKVGGKDCYLVAEQMVVDHFTTEQIANNWLQLKASIFIVRYLTFQAITFREKAPKNAAYTSPRIQKEILHVFSVKVKKTIRKEIGDAKFCIMVDEDCDESMKEQMVVVFRYIDAEGFVKQRCFGFIHVVDTTLKKEIYFLLSQHCLNIQNIREQGYDGESNMRGMLNGLQALILNDYPYAYYIHLKALKQVVPISHFFLIKILETGNGLNQIGTLQQSVETRWSSHFKSVSSLLRMFTSTVEVLQNIIDDAIDGEHQVEAESAYEGLTSFEFIFILYLEKETMEITDKLCQALQSQSQDILNAMHLVSSTKTLIQKFKDDGWDDLLTPVILSCEKHCIDVLDMNAYSQLQELNYRFNEDAMELLRFSSALEPREASKSFRSSDLCLLVKNFYPQDFTDYDKQVLEKNLYHFEHNVVQDPKFKKLKSLSELSQWLVRTGNSEHYKLIYRMMRLRAFSTTKVVKTNLRNKMENDFLTDSLMLYIEKNIASTFSLDSIGDDFEDLKERQVPFS